MSKDKKVVKKKETVRKGITKPPRPAKEKKK